MGKKLTKQSWNRGDEFKHRRIQKLQMTIGQINKKMQCNKKINLMKDLCERLERRLANDDAILPMHRL